MSGRPPASFADAGPGFKLSSRDFQLFVKRFETLFDFGGSYDDRSQFVTNGINVNAGIFHVTKVSQYTDQGGAR